MNILYHSPGQVATILVELLDSNGLRFDGYAEDGYFDGLDNYFEDGYAIPEIKTIYLPDLTTSDLYPLSMEKLDVGVYIHHFTIPKGSLGVGTYLVDIAWVDENELPKQGMVQIVVTAPGGIYSVSSG